MFITARWVENSINFAFVVGTGWTFATVQKLINFCCPALYVFLVDEASPSLKNWLARMQRWPKWNSITGLLWDPVVVSSVLVQYNCMDTKY